MSNSVQLTNLWDDTRRGNVESFNQIYTKLYRPLNQFLLKICKDKDISHDILQDLSIKLWENKTKIGSIQNIKTYFFKSSRTLAFNDLKDPGITTVKLEENIIVDF